MSRQSQHPLVTMEQQIQRAKIEINAYANHVINRTGLAALQGELPLLRLADGEEQV